MDGINPVIQFCSKFRLFAFRQSIITRIPLLASLLEGVSPQLLISSSEISKILYILAEPTESVGPVHY